MVPSHTSDILYQLKTHRCGPAEVKEQTLLLLKRERNVVLFTFFLFFGKVELDLFVCFDHWDWASRFLLPI